MDTIWNDLLVDQLVVGFAIVMALMAIWLGVLFNYTILHASILSFLGFIYLLWIARRVKKAKNIYAAYKKGYQGERLMEDQLDEIRKAGFDVFHDFALKDEHGMENIDHIIVGPPGVFTLETKNWTAKGGLQDHRITFDGTQLKIGDHVQEEKVLKQPRRQAAKLQGILQPVIKKPLWVVPILCFRDRYVQLTRFNPTGLQVVNQRGLGSFILSRDQKLTPDELRKITAKLRSMNRSE